MAIAASQRWRPYALDVASSVSLFLCASDSVLATVTAGRQKLATIHFGEDKDAALKSRLTGVALENYILSVDLYR